MSCTKLEKIIGSRNSSVPSTYGLDFDVCVCMCVYTHIIYIPFCVSIVCSSNPGPNGKNSIDLFLINKEQSECYRAVSALLSSWCVEIDFSSELVDATYFGNFKYLLFNYCISLKTLQLHCPQRLTQQLWDYLIGACACWLLKVCVCMYDTNNHLSAVDSIANKLCKATVVRDESAHCMTYYLLLLL